MHVCSVFYCSMRLHSKIHILLNSLGVASNPYATLYSPVEGLCIYGPVVCQNYCVFALFTLFTHVQTQR